MKLKILTINCNQVVNLRPNETVHLFTNPILAGAPQVEIWRPTKATRHPPVIIRSPTVSFEIGEGNNSEMEIKGFVATDTSGCYAAVAITFA